MTKSKFLVILVLTLVFASLITCLVACDPSGDTGKYNIVYMDGQTSLGTVALEPGSVITPITPTKEGYTFVGWYKDAAFIEPFVTNSTIESNIVLYAKFAAKATYIMVDNDDGNELQKVSVTQGTSYSLTTPQKVGYEFENYTYYDEDAEQTKIFSKEGVYSFATSIRIKAKWKIKTYKVKLVDSGNTAEQPVEYGSRATLEQGTKTGYTFVGWFTEEDELFDKNTVITEDITLTAKYEANTYKVNINSKGGTTIPTQTVTYGQDYLLPTPTKTGYDFAGYQQLDETPFLTSGNFGWTTDINLIATWSIKSYSVKFDLDGAIVDTQTVEYGNYATLPSAENGYEYKKVYSDSGKETEITLATTAIEDNKTFYLVKEAKVYTITVDGLPKGENTFTASYNGTYTLTESPVKAGFIFDEYTFGGETFNYTGTYTWTMDITVTAEFDIDPLYNKINITLKDGNTVITTKTVDKGATTVTLTDVNTAKTGYSFVGWFTDAQLSVPYVDGDITFNQYVDLYAKYSLNNWTITIDEKGGDDVNNVTADYNGGYTLPDLTRKGYTFAGYKYGDTAFAKSGTYTIDKDITVEAQWTRNEITLVFMTGTTTYDTIDLYQYQTINDSGVTAPSKTGYTFSKWQVGGVDFANDKEISADTTFVAVFTANEYVITLDFGDSVTETVDVVYDESYTLPANPVKAGYTFSKYQYNDVDFSANGTYTYATDITVTIVWTKDETLFSEQDGYFKERASESEDFTYVFLTGKNYDFSAYYQKVEEINPSQAGMFDATTTAFTPAKTGTFTLKLTPKNGEAFERSAKVVNNVISTSFGANFSALSTQATNTTLFKNTNSNVVLNVGYTNFIPDIAILKDATTAITIEDANMAVLAKEGDTDVTNLVTLSGNTLTFDSTLVGKTIALTFKKPKYALSAANISDISLTVTLNDGVNVYNNADMKSAYSNGNIQTINVLRNITAELVETDYYRDLGGKGKTIANVTITDGTNNYVLENIDTGTPYNDYTHGVYVRITANLNDNLVINGNYFQVDGSKLPYIDNRYDTYGSDGSSFTDGNSYRIANVQTGVFLYTCGTVGKGGISYVNGNVTFNNLAISSNNISSLSAYSQDLGDGKKPLLKMSASYIGIVNRGGTINMNNVSIRNAQMGMMCDGDISGDETVKENQTHSVVMNLTDCIINQCWADSIYTYKLCKIVLKNTDLGQSNGAAISVDDIPLSQYACELNPVIIMDKYTASHINNFVAGDEAWFVAYGEGGTGTLIKGKVDPMVQQATGYTVIRKFGGVDKFNFVILVRSGGEYEVSEWSNQTKGMRDVGGTMQEVYVGDKDNMPIADTQTTTYGGATFFYGDTTEMATFYIDNQPYYPLCTDMIGATGNSIMWVYIPLYPLA